jgi:lipopolysaccharide export LptBFGC system permease protein LptF
MPRWLTILACLFWIVPLAAGVQSWARDGFYAELYYLLGVPLVMIALTLFVARFANGSPRRGTILMAASLLAVLAVFLLLGVLGADV